jgi:hypothetical protein
MGAASPSIAEFFQSVGEISATKSHLPAIKNLLHRAFSENGGRYQPCESPPDDTPSELAKKIAK